MFLTEREKHPVPFPGLKSLPQAEGQAGRAWNRNSPRSWLEEAEPLHPGGGSDGHSLVNENDCL